MKVWAMVLLTLVAAGCPQLEFNGVYCLDGATAEYEFALGPVPTGVVDYRAVVFEYIVDNQPVVTSVATFDRLADGTVYYTAQRPWVNGVHVTEVVSASVTIVTGSGPQTYYLANPGWPYSLSCSPTAVGVLSVGAGDGTGSPFWDSVLVVATTIISLVAAAWIMYRRGWFSRRKKG